MRDLITQLAQDFPSVRFTSGKQFCWSPETNEVIYDESKNQETAIWSLLHETGHALLGHATYKSDITLLKMEVEAWSRAKAIALKYNIEIGEDHIEDCLDTYRDWLYKRSICPSCTSKSLQQGDYSHYRCFNCHMTWRVSPNRFCRAYRSTKNVAQSFGLTI